MKKLVEKRPDILFLLKVFVIVSRDPHAAKSIVCSKSLSLLEDAYEHKAVPDKECPSKEVDDNTAFAAANGLTAAPALVFPDGSVQLGYSDAAALEKSINQAMERRQPGAEQKPTK